MHYLCTNDKEIIGVSEAASISGASGVYKMEMKSEAKLTTFEAISMIVPQRRQAHHRGEI